MRTKDFTRYLIERNRSLIYDDIFGLPYIFIEEEGISFKYLPQVNDKAWTDYFLGITNVTPQISRYIEEVRHA